VLADERNCSQRPLLWVVTTYIPRADIASAQEDPDFCIVQETQSAVVLASDIPGER
jgi:hypothetical protein